MSWFGVKSPEALLAPRKHSRDAVGLPVFIEKHWPWRPRNPPGFVSFLVLFPGHPWWSDIILGLLGLSGAKNEGEMEQYHREAPLLPAP